MSCDKIDQSSSIDLVYVATNMAHYSTWFELPECPDLYRWHLSFNTGDLSHVVFEDAPPFNESGLLVGERSVVIFQALPTG